MLSIYLSVCRSVCLSVCLPICQSGLSVNRVCRSVCRPVIMNNDVLFFNSYYQARSNNPAVPSHAARLARQIKANNTLSVLLFLSVIPYHIIGIASAAANPDFLHSKGMLVLELLSQCHVTYGYRAHVCRWATRKDAVTILPIRQGIELLNFNIDSPSVSTKLWPE